MTSWSIHRVLNALGVAVWPEIGCIKHEPMGSDEDVAWFEARMYFDDLAADIEASIVEHQHLLFPYGPTVEDILKRDLSPAARRAVYNPWPTFEELWSAA